MRSSKLEGLVRTRLALVVMIASCWVHGCASNPSSEPERMLAASAGASGGASIVVSPPAPQKACDDGNDDPFDGCSRNCVVDSVSFPWVVGVVSREAGAYYATRGDDRELVQLDSTLQPIATLTSDLYVDDVLPLAGGGVAAVVRTETQRVFVEKFDHAGVRTFRTELPSYDSAILAELDGALFATMKLERKGVIEPVVVGLDAQGGLLWPEPTLLEAVRDAAGTEEPFMHAVGAWGGVAHAFFRAGSGLVRDEVAPDGARRSGGLVAECSDWSFCRIELAASDHYVVMLGRWGISTPASSHPLEGLELRSFSSNHSSRNVVAVDVPAGYGGAEVLALADGRLLLLLVADHELSQQRKVLVREYDRFGSLSRESKFESWSSPWRLRELADGHLAMTFSRADAAVSARFALDALFADCR